MIGLFTLTLGTKPSPTWEPERRGDLHCWRGAFLRDSQVRSRILKRNIAWACRGLGNLGAHLSLSAGEVEKGCWEEPTIESFQSFPEKLRTLINIHLKKKSRNKQSRHTGQCHWNCWLRESRARTLEMACRNCLIFQMNSNYGKSLKVSKVTWGWLW